ncbi:hypothetical protein Q9966_015800 [Columba livia]|nr:hypothetical protein Q9966_015800 [Columba livia]
MKPDSFREECFSVGISNRLLECYGKRSNSSPMEKETPRTTTTFVVKKVKFCIRSVDTKPFSASAVSRRNLCTPICLFLGHGNGLHSQELLTMCYRLIQLHIFSLTPFPVEAMAPSDLSIIPCSLMSQEIIASVPKPVLFIEIVGEFICNKWSTECKFTCASGKCLYLGSLICNQQNDCGDNSDEENCLLVTEHPPPGIFS